MPLQEKSSERPQFDLSDQSAECQLRFAAKYGTLDSIYHLTAHGKVNINSEDHKGCTPLVISVLEGEREQCVELLCKLGADVNHKVDQLHGYGALHFAAEKNQADVINVLVEYGAAMDTQTFTGCTPLHLAAMHGNMEAARLLCLSGADVNIPEWYNGYTPLHYAINNGHVSVVYLLLEFNANLEFVSINHRAALVLGDKELYRHLLYLKTEPKHLEKICLDVIRKHFLWPNACKNVSKLPLPSNIKKKILLLE